MFSEMSFKNVLVVNINIPFDDFANMRSLPLNLKRSETSSEQMFQKKKKKHSLFLC